MRFEHIKSDLELSKKDYRSNRKPTWCSGCTNFGVLEALTNVLAELRIDPAYANIVSGIGCSSRLPFWMNTFGFHTLHGRAIPVAIGSRLARPDIPVIVTAGDGDLFAIGVGHFVHAARKNIDLTVICMDNRTFAMTKNQASPTSKKGYKGSLTPYGKLSIPLNVVEFAIACEASFVAQTFTSDINHMKDMFSQAIMHRGFSFVNVISHCLTYHKIEKLKKDKERLIDINKELGHDPTDKIAALSKAAMSLKYDQDEKLKIPIGVIWRKDDAISFEEEVAKLKEKYIKK